MTKKVCYNCRYNEKEIKPSAIRAMNFEIVGWVPAEKYFCKKYKKRIPYDDCMNCKCWHWRKER